MATLPEVRGQGIGVALAHDALREAKAAGRGPLVTTLLRRDGFSSALTKGNSGYSVRSTNCWVYA